MWSCERPSHDPSRHGDRSRSSPVGGTERVLDVGRGSEIFTLEDVLNQEPA